MKKVLQDFLNRFLLEITVIGVGAFATFVITTKVALATHEEKINNSKDSIEILRKENREDHKQIIDMLRK